MIGAFLFVLDTPKCGYVKRKDIGNTHSPTVIIVPITSRVHTKAKLPTHTEVGSFEGLDKNSLILAEQIRTIDKRRLENYIGNHFFKLLSLNLHTVSVHNQPVGVGVFVRQLAELLFPDAEILCGFLDSKLNRSLAVSIDLAAKAAATEQQP